jgi:hypothetical protein
MSGAIPSSMARPCAAGSWSTPGGPRGLVLRSRYSSNANAPHASPLDQEVELVHHRYSSGCCTGRYSERDIPFNCHVLQASCSIHHPTRQSSPVGGGLRSSLRCAALRLSASRRARAALLGLVARRFRGTTSASAMRSASRSSASSRLRVCERSSWATATTRVPARASKRARCASLNDGEALTSKIASTREAVTFACWPPGPEERLVRMVISATGIASASFTRMRRPP